MNTNGRLFSKVPRTAVVLGLVVGASVGITGCTNQDNPVAPERFEDVFQLHGSDGSWAVLRVAGAHRDSLILESLHVPVGDTLPSSDPSIGYNPAAIALGALTVWSAYQVITVCVPPFVDDLVRTRTINWWTKDACFEQVAISASSRAVSLKVIPPVKVTALRSSIKSMLGDVFSHSKLQRVINRQTKPTITSLARGIFEEFYGALYYGFKWVFEQIRN